MAFVAAIPAVRNDAGLPPQQFTVAVYSLARAKLLTIETYTGTADGALDRARTLKQLLRCQQAAVQVSRVEVQQLDRALAALAHADAENAEEAARDVIAEGLPCYPPRARRAKGGAR